MDWRRNLLWIDGSGGAAVGVGMLLLHGWLTELYQLPDNLVWFIAWTNLAYGCYSLTLASRQRRPKGFVRFLVVANVAWGCVCLGLAVTYWSVASVFGLAALILEGIYVGGLGLVEWKYREWIWTE